MVISRLLHSYLMPKQFLAPCCSSNTILCSYATLRERAKKNRMAIGLYEPVPENTRTYPDYALISVRLQAYDFVPLELYQAYIHTIAKRFKFIVQDSYAVPYMSQYVKLLKPRSSVVVDEFKLNTYDRWLKIAQVPTVHLPLFVLLLQTHLPVGVKMTIKEYERADEDIRYIPQVELERAQFELKSLDDPAVRRNLGWE